MLTRREFPPSDNRIPVYYTEQCAREKASRAYFYGCITGAFLAVVAQLVVYLIVT